MNSTFNPSQFWDIVKIMVTFLNIIYPKYQLFISPVSLWPTASIILFRKSSKPLNLCYVHSHRIVPRCPKVYTILVDQEDSRHFLISLQWKRAVGGIGTVFRSLHIQSFIPDCFWGYLTYRFVDICWSQWTVPFCQPYAMTVVDRV